MNFRERNRTTMATLALWLVSCGLLHAQTVSGTVRNAITLDPVVDAIVGLQAGAVHTTSASDGTFSLSTSDAGLLVAGAQGFYYQSVPVTPPAIGVEIYLAPVPITDDPGYVMQDPTACASCHPDQFAEWSGSPMARAGFNTWVYDIYDGSGTPGGMGGFVYTRDSVHADENPASECSSCHQPETWISAPFTALEDLTALSPSAMHGVSCEVCHKIADVNVAQINFPGIYPGAVTFNRPLPGTQIMYGVLGDVGFSLPGLMQPSYNPQMVAETCGVCHQDANDHDGDHDFEDPGSVISEPTYLEWLSSDYSDPTSANYRTCVDCHMPPSGAVTASTFPNPPIVRDPTTIRSHEIRGTTPEYLENAVTLELSAIESGGVISVEAAIHNDQTGHHVPTGVTVRNVILLVEAVREEDGLMLTSTGSQVIHDLAGIGDPSAGYYAGLPGKFFAKVNHAADGSGPTFFTDATGIQFDSRIPALATDTSSYSFEIPSNGGTLRVRARLIYRRAFRFIVDAKGWVYDGHGNPLADIEPPHFGHLMEVAEAVIALPYTPPSFRRGDANGDGTVQLSDAITLLSTLFQGGGAPLTCPDAADSNDNGVIDLADPVFLLSYLFVAGGPPPPPPGPTDCGPDFSGDELGPCLGSGCP